MCFDVDEPEQKAPPPPAPPPVEPPRLSIKGSAEKNTSQRKKTQKSGKSAFRSDLAINSSSSTGSGLNI